MSAPLILAGIILKPVVENTISYFINKGWDKILSKEEYEEELLKVVDETIVEYKKTNSISTEKPKFPFYDSQIFINEIIKIGLFNNVDKSLLKNELSTNTNIILPTDENLNTFFGLFIAKCNSNEKLKKLHIETNYKSEVFKLSEMIGGIRASLDNVVNKISIELKDEWKRQINIYKKEIESFKPSTAINLLDALEEAINESDYSITPKIAAKIHYLRALCYELLQDALNAQKEYLYCYQKEPENPTYQEKAVWTYYMLDEFDKAKNITDIILITNFDNPTANFIISISEDEEEFCKNLQEKPDYLKNNLTFRHLILRYGQKKQYKSSLELLISNSEFKASQGVTYANFFETVYNIEFIVFKYFANNVFFDFNERIYPCCDIKNLFDECKNLKNSIEKSEVVHIYKGIFFWYYLSSYIINDDKNDLIKAVEYFNPQDFNGSLLLANALQYENYIDKALDVLRKMDDPINETPFLRAFCYAKLKDDANYSREINLYISQLKIVSEVSFKRIFPIVCVLLDRDHTIDINFEKLIQKPFESTDYKNLIQSTVLALSHDEDANPKQIYDIANGVDISNNIKAVTAYILLRITEPQLSVDLYRQFINKSKYNQDLFYYIQALYYTKKDNKELLNLLKNWRLNANHYDELLLQWEYSLRGQLNNWKECLDIAEIFYNRHPDKDSVISNYLFCLEKNGEKEKVKELIDNISPSNFSNPHSVRDVAIIMHQNGYVEKAFEFLYPFAKNRENSELRMLYFDFCLRIKNETILKLYDTVSEGTYVLIQYEDTLTESLIQINSGNTSNEMQQALIGKCEGDTISLKMPASGIYKKVTVKKIMNKHLALHKELLNDAEKPLESNLPVTSFHLPEDSKIEDFFVKSFAVEEDTRKKAFKEHIEQYKRGGIPYFVVTILFQGDYLKTYSILSSKECGILLNPYIQNMNMVDLEKKEFVLDFSSFFCIYDIYKELHLIPPSKFIISNIIKEFIVNKINEARNAPEAELGIDINFEGIKPIFYPKGYKEIQVAYLEEINSWIEQYCTVIFIEERLDELRVREYESKDRAIYAYIADYMHILNTPNRILITDDTLLYNQHAQQKSGISSHHYLKTVFNESIINAEFLKRNYIGVPIDQNFLKDEFIKKITGAENLYLKCLDSLSYLLPLNESMVISIICAFLKDIYTDSIVIEDINRETVFFFTGILKSASVVSFIIALGKRLLYDFRLLGLKQDAIMKNYMVALNILFPKSNYSFN